MKKTTKQWITKERARVFAVALLLYLFQDKLLALDKYLRNYPTINRA